MEEQLTQIQEIIFSLHFQQYIDQPFSPKTVSHVWWGACAYTILYHRTFDTFEVILDYKEKDSPHEQEREASGLLKTKPVFTMVCSKSISEPLMNK